MKCRTEIIFNTKVMMEEKMSEKAHVSLITKSISNLTDSMENDPRTKLVDQLFSQYDRRDTPGCVIAIIKDGRIIYKRAYGMADLERDVPLTTKSVFELGSLSKQFVAMSILLLSESGSLSIDDDIRKYIPEIPSYRRIITINHLIHHTSGIRDYYGLMTLSGMPIENHYTEAQIFELITRQKELNFPPGEKYLYSNTGYFLLGNIVKIISGKSLQEYADENIFKPLGMNSTLFNDDFTRVIKNRAIGYFSKKEGGYGLANYVSDIVGDGGVMTSVEDLFLWDQNFYYNKLGKGRQEIIKQFLTPGALNNGKEIDYAFAIEIETYNGLKTFGHDGGWAGYRSHMIRFPGNFFSVICLSNLADFGPTAINKRIADIYLRDKSYINIQKSAKISMLKAKSNNQSELLLKEIEGAYQNKETREIYRLETLNGKVFVNQSSGRIFQLVPINEKRFKSVGAPVDIQVIFINSKKSKNKNIYLKVIITEKKPIFFRQINLFSPSIEKLNEYSGSYYSKELDVTYILKVKDDQLTYYLKDIKETVVLYPTIKDEFRSDVTIFNFIRNRKGQVKGLNVETYRIKKISFFKI